MPRLLKLVVAVVLGCAAGHATADEAAVDHAAIIRSLDDAALQRGKATYDNVCAACHGPDGKTPTNPLARSFATAPMANGADPHSLYKTLTLGFDTMPAQTWLEPAQRYEVIHYLRETFLKKDNPAQYVKVTDDYLAALPKPAAGAIETKGPVERDYGPVLAAQLAGAIKANNALHFRLPGDVTFSYDLHTMRSSGAWTGGFLDLSETQHYKQRGEGMPKPRGTMIAGLETYGWLYGDSFDIPKDAKRERGPLRSDWLTYRGHYLHGDTAILSYAVRGRDVLEAVGVDRSPMLLALHHTLRIEPGDEALHLALGRLPGKLASHEEGEIANAGANQVTWFTASDDSGRSIDIAFVTDDEAPILWRIDDAARIIWTIPRSNRPTLLRVIRSSRADKDAHGRFLEYLKFSASRAAIVDPKDLTRGGPRRWKHELTTAGKLGEPVNGYALDTIAVPFENPYSAWMRTSALDFFGDGRAVVTTHGGDVWIVSGIDATLDKITWKRFAAGLFEPFGVKVVDGVVYVTARDGLKRLHDYNADGEADFIEAFHVDEDVSSSFHAYNFDLQTDAAGNFYFAKAGQHTQYDRPGTIMKVPPTGGPAEIVAWGIRTPNGMGKLPGDRFTVSDNQGPWMPAGKVSVIRADAFLGNMPNKNQQAWVLEHTGGKMPETFDEPFIWTPQELDNSCGGQVWADDKRWGPLAGRLIHSSFGKGWLYYLSLQEVGPAMQASIVKLPHQWDAGVMRLRVNPADGQVYGVGLSGWQGPARGKDGCLQRLRYTGEPARIIESTRVTPAGVELRFSFELDPAVASSVDAYRSEMWNYLWSSKYGSDRFSVRHPDTKGHDAVRIASARLTDDHRGVHLTMPDLAVCDQLMLDVKIKDAAGVEYTERIYFTIHAIPD